MDSKPSTSILDRDSPLISPELVKEISQALNNGDYDAKVIRDLFKRNRMAAKRYARYGMKK